MKKFPIFCLALLLFLPQSVWAAEFSIDSAHSRIMFKVPELGVNLIGFFTQCYGKITLSDDNSQLTSVDATVHVSSVYTRNDKRDSDLRGPGIFDTAQFPEAHFVSKKIEGGKITGDLTIKGKTKPVVFTYTRGEVSQDQQKNTKVALSAKGTISRKDYGITYNRKLDGGKMLLGDEIELILEIKAILKK